MKNLDTMVNEAYTWFDAEQAKVESIQIRNLLKLEEAERNNYVKAAN